MTSVAPPELGTARANHEYGIYAIEIIGGNPSVILAENCTEILVKEDGSIWYLPNNNGNVIPMVEKWTYIPFHAIARIAFNKDVKP